MEPNIYESIIVYEAENREVVAMIPLKLGERAVLKNGYKANIVLDTEAVLYEDNNGKVIYKEEKK